MKISLADGSKGVYDEEEGIGTFTLSNAVILELVEDVCKGIASGSGYTTTNLMQAFIDKNPEDLLKSSDYPNYMLSENMCNALNECYKSIIRYAIAAAIMASFLPNRNQRGNQEMNILLL
jgi:hypothetical protein